MDGLRLSALYETLVDNIECNSKSLKELPLSESENRFFKELLISCDRINMSGYLKLERLSNRSFNVWCNCYVGKIKLQGNDTFMQVLSPTDRIYKYEGKSLDFYIKQIDRWIKYIECCKHETL